MKNPRVQFREAQTPTLLGKARLKEDSLWRQTAPLGRYSIWNPRVQLDRLWVKKKGACWASKQQNKTQVQSSLKCWDTHKHKFPTQFLGIHAWCLDRSDGATEKETMIPVIFGRRGSGFFVHRLFNTYWSSVSEELGNGTQPLRAEFPPAFPNRASLPSVAVNFDLKRDFQTHIFSTSWKA